MNRGTRNLMIAVAAMATFVGAASANPGVLRSYMDETGLGIWDAVPTPMDAFKEFYNPAENLWEKVTYTLPIMDTGELWTVTPGYLVITESGGGVSDVIEFTAGRRQIIFWSDPILPTLDPGLGPIVTVPEVFLPDNPPGSWPGYGYGAEYEAADSYLPGFAFLGGLPASVDYRFVSDPIPAPGAALLAVIGLGLVGWVKKRLA